MELERLVEDYQENINLRNKDTLGAMSKIQVLGVIGGTSSGKTTLIEELVELAPTEVGFVKNETSRRPSGRERANNREFTFRTKQQVIKDIKNGDLVQVAFGPNGDLYCTRPASYSNDKTTVIALMPKAVEEFRRLPIKSFREAYIVPFKFDVWQQWFEHQANDRGWDEGKRLGRKREALSSYEFAFNQTNMPFVLNDDKARATKRLLQVARGGMPDDHAKARRIAEENYKKLKQELRLE